MQVRDVQVVAGAVKQRYLRIPGEQFRRELVVDHLLYLLFDPLGTDGLMGCRTLCTYLLGFLELVDEELSYFAC